MPATVSTWWYADSLDAVIAAGFDDIGFAAVGGASPKRMLLSRQNGHRYLFKAEDQAGTPRPYRAHADHLASAMAARLQEPGEFVPVGLIEFDYGRGPVLGSVQPFMDDACEPDLYIGQVPISADDIARVQREHVLDWLISNHDSHPGQWVRVDGRLLPIDKTQAGKHLGDDRLDGEYHPNGAYWEAPPVYNDLFAAVQAGRVTVDPDAILPTLDRVDSLNEATFMAILAGYLSAVEPAKREKYPRLWRERKRDLRKDFSAYYREMLGRAVRF